MIAATGNGTAAPLDAERLAAALRGASRPRGRETPRGPETPRGLDTMWTDLRIVGATASTNTDVMRAAAAGADEGLVLAAEFQTAGKGRQGRAWQTKPGAALTFSVLLRPDDVPQAARGWLPLLAGVAAARALGRVTGLDARLKWPNDVLVCGGKLAGILAEQAAGAVVVGIGINVLGTEHDLPVATATSLERCGAGGADRTDLLGAILGEFELRYAAWRATGHGDAEASGLRSEYLSLSATVGRQVRVQLPADRELTGVAAGVDRAGQLLVVPPAGAPVVAVSAGDVIHVRPI